MKSRWIKITCLVVGILIALPIVVFGAFLGTAYLCDKYTVHKLHMALPDAYKYDYQCYETDNGAYQADFYKFSECNEDFIKDWETEKIGYYVFKTCSINAGIYKPVLIINTTAKCATIEYHCNLWE